MDQAFSRRTFMKAAAATGVALAAGPGRWGWAQAGSPFGPFQDDPILMLPEGFRYVVVGRTGDVLLEGRGPTARPAFPDLNVVFPQGDGKILLSTSHEIPADETPVHLPPPGEEYDPQAGGAITSLLLSPELVILESSYNAGGMIRNCSGSGTPWGTVLTGEESTKSYDKPHGFIWEVDPQTHQKTKLPACGRFEHETAVVHRRTGNVYLTEDSGTDSLLYRMKPNSDGRLHRGGRLQAYRRKRRGGEWVDINKPLSMSPEPSKQGIRKGATAFQRLEGGRFRGRYFYFTETEDDSTCGKIWRLNTRNNDLELWAQGGRDADMCMPDNVTFDKVGNMWVTEDKPSGAGEKNNRLLFIDRPSGNISPFAKLTNAADEPTGPVFSPNGKYLFLNLQRGGADDVTIAITGPFPDRATSATRLASDENAPPPGAQPEEATHLSSLALPLSMPLTAAAGLLSLRRRGAVDDVDPLIQEVAEDMGEPEPIPEPKRRIPRERL